MISQSPVCLLPTPGSVRLQNLLPHSHLLIAPIGFVKRYCNNLKVFKGAEEFTVNQMLFAATFTDSSEKIAGLFETHTHTREADDGHHRHPDCRCFVYSHRFCWRIIFTLSLLTFSSNSFSRFRCLPASF
jgi:hypothetical protein